MPIAPALSLDQLQVLLTVVETGSFAAAGRKLNRATSAISYAVDTLERQLGIALFDRGSTRRPKLTLAGEAVVVEARVVAHGADMLRARVKGLVEGLEAEVSLIVDQMVPEERLAEALRSFHRRFPTVPLRLGRENMGGVERLLRSGQFEIGVAGLLHVNRDGFTARQVDGVPVIPVAAPDHPLAHAGRPKIGAAREHLQIVLTDRGGADRRTYGVVAGSIWRVGDLTLKHSLLLAGIGWGGMPEPLVRADLEAGRLIRLNLADFRGGKYPLQVIFREDSPLGPAGSCLIEQLAEQLGRDGL